jgi:hypothetical protein
MTSEDIFDLPREARIADAKTQANREYVYDEYRAGRLTVREALWRIEGYHLWSLNGETPETDQGWREFVRYLLRTDASQRAATAAKCLTPISDTPALYTPPRAQIRGSAREESL